jgi:hypothetical protein
MEQYGVATVHPLIFFLFCSYIMEQYGVAFQVFRELVLSLLGKHFANTQQRTYKVAISMHYPSRAPNWTNQGPCIRKQN